MSIFLTSVQQATAAVSCDAIFLKQELAEPYVSRQEYVRNFDYRSVLNERGIDPSQLKVLFSTLGKNSMTAISLYYKGEHIGSLISSQVIVNGTTFWESSNSRIVEAFEGKGLGTVMYLALARYLSEKQNMQLVSTPIHSEKAERLWLRLNQSGVASKLIEFQTKKPKRGKTSVGAQPFRYIIEEAPLLVASHDVYEFLILPSSP